METHCWRVKLYQLELGGIWNDQGTGFVSCEQVVCNDASDGTHAGYLMVKREEDNSVLLQSAIQYEDAYERQGESIIMWRENCGASGVEIDYALSFENTDGCYAIWDAINDVQAFPYKMLDGVGVVGQGLHSRDYVDRHSREWLLARGEVDERDRDDVCLTYAMDDHDGSPTPPSLFMQELASSYIGLPSVSTENLDEIKDKILSAFPSQKEVYASVIRDRGGAYLQELLQLAEDALAAGDTPTCQRVAEIVRGVVYLNDAELLELIVSSHETFMRVAGAMEQDPLLLEPARFREDIASSPHGPKCIVGDNFGSGGGDASVVGPARKPSLRAGRTADMVTQLFRARLLRDRMIRPLPDDSGATALNALLCSLQAGVCEQLFKDTTYLRKILNLIELPNNRINGSRVENWLNDVEEDEDDDGNSRANTTITLDDLANMKAGLCFLRELFFMSRQLSIEQRSELYSACLNDLRVPFFSALRYTLCVRENCAAGSQPALLGAEKSSDVGIPPACTAASVRVIAAEILSAITAVVPSFLRRAVGEGAVPAPPPYCSNTPASATSSSTAQAVTNGKVDNDCSLLYVIIERICCDEEAAVTEHLGEAVKVLLDPERFDKHDKDRFLALFYDFYVQWLLVPFAQESIAPDEVCRIVPLRRVAADCGEAARNPQDNFSAISSSRRFLCEIFSQCANCHSYRMKFFIVRNNVICRILKLLKSRHRHMHIGAIKFIRAILSVKDEFYHKHIVKYDILKPMFDLFENIHMKDNLITSAIVEVVDFIRAERVVTLICYLVEKYKHIFALCLGQDVAATGTLEAVVGATTKAGRPAHKLLHVEVFQKFLHTYEQVSDPAHGGSYLANASSSETGESGIGVVRKQKNENLAEIESEEAYFLDDSDEESGARTNEDSASDEDEYGPFLHSMPLLRSVPGPRSVERADEEQSALQRRGYFDDLHSVVGKRAAPDISSGNFETHMPKQARQNGNSLKLISDLYDDDEGDGEVAENIQYETSEAIAKDGVVCDDISNGAGRFCYSPPPPSLPPLRSKFEQDIDNEDGDDASNIFFQNKLAHAGKKVLRNESINFVKSSTDTAASVPAGGVKFSMKKKSKYF